MGTLRSRDRRDPNLQGGLRERPRLKLDQSARQQRMLRK